MRRSLAAVLGIVTLSGADAAAAAERCAPPRGAAAVAANSYVRVYRANTITYACNRASGRRFRLDDPRRGARVYATGGYRVQLGRTFVAYVVRYEEVEGYVDSLNRLDVTRPRPHEFGVWDEPRGDGLLGFRLAKTGAIAWAEITNLGDEGAIWLRGRRGTKRLDRGPPELAHSFAVSHDRRWVYWTSGDEPRSALLR